MLYSYDLAFVWNLFVFAIHGALTGHEVALNVHTGKPLCVDPKCMDKPRT